MDNNGIQQGYQQAGYQQAGYQQSGQGMPQPKPNNYLILAIFTTLCCCLPLGIVGIVYASKVNSLYTMGQFDAATEASNNAKKWSLIGIGCGVAVSLIYFILIIAGALALPGSTGSY